MRRSIKVKPSLAALLISLAPKLKKMSLHVKDTVGDDLGVDRDLVGSLGQGPDDGVSGPKADISTGQSD
jgi:hypothetical protein